MKLGAFQAPLCSPRVVDLIRERVRWCEGEGVAILCCPEAILGGLADYSHHPFRFALPTAPGKRGIGLEATLAPLSSDTVTTIIGFTELSCDNRLFNSAAVFHRGSVLGVYRKQFPAIRRSVYSAGSESPVFRVGELTFGIVICNDSNYAAPAAQMAAQGASALFVPTNNGLPRGCAGPEIVHRARKADIGRARENGMWVIRADAAGLWRNGVLGIVGNSRSSRKSGGYSAVVTRRYYRGGDRHGGSMQLTAAASRQLRTDGFTVIAGPVAPEEMERLAAAYDREILTADPAEIHEGSTTTRANDFVNRDPAFDFLYVHPPLLAACGLTLAGPFRLSTMHARTLRARTPAQRLHVDYPCDERGWPMLGFIFMIDEFRRDNGATRFLPRSQGLREMPAVAEREMPAVAEDDERLVPACGPAGRMIVFNGSVWHGHGPNLSREPRRSIQGAFIRREDKPAIDPARLHPETFSRLGATARILVGAKLDESK